MTDQTTGQMAGNSQSPITRRTLLKWSGAAGMIAVAGPLVSCSAITPGGTAGSDANGLFLPEGFTSRIIARGGQQVPGTAHQFPIFPDGAATFADPATPGGWYYVVNHEVPFGGGGVTSFRFAPDGSILDAYPICEYTSLNCAGGATPWGTWLTCEEFDGGIVWECDPTRPRSARPRPRLGAFAHEAAAVAADGRIYLTEDRPDSGLYRFTPDSPGDLTAGLLEIAVEGPTDTEVRWAAVPDPSAESGPCREQLPNSLRFDGGEGIDTDGTTVWFTTKGDNRVWQYDTASSTLEVYLQGGGSSMLAGVDNLLYDSGSGTVLVAEDGDDMQVVMIRPDRSLAQVVRVAGHEGSEVTGPTFSPDGSRLYFSSQRAPIEPFGVVGGITYEVTGPFDELLGRTAP